MLALLASISGCMTLARTKGAKTLERGQVELAMLGPAVRRADDPTRALPIPQGGVELRVGVGRNVDLGFQGYLIGAGFDVRYRFFHRGRLHLAVAPGFGVILQPDVLNVADLGGFEGKLPLTGELEVTRWLGLSAGPQLVLRERLNLGFEGTVWRFDLYAGGGMRAEAHGGIFAIGLAFDVLYAPTRFSRQPLYVAGFDLKFRSRTKAAANARRARQGRPLRWPEADTEDRLE